MMNPLLWKREHQLALACAIALGSGIGFLSGLRFADTYSSFRWGALYCWRVNAIYGGDECLHLLSDYWLRILMWSMLGALFGAGIIYIRQLLRA